MTDIDRRCLRLLEGFRGWPIQWNHVQCCEADPCCHGNEIWAIFAKISNCFFFFVFRCNRAIFPPLVLRDPLYKTLFFDFLFRLPNPQNWLPKIWPKIVYNSACMADKPEMFAPNRGFSGMADSMEPCTMLRGRPVLLWQQHLGKFGYFSTKSPMSRLVCQIDQICLGLPAETTSGADLCCQGDDMWDRRGV